MLSAETRGEGETKSSHKTDRAKKKKKKPLRGIKKSENQTAEKVNETAEVQDKNRK